MRELWKHFKAEDLDLRIDECGIQEFNGEEFYSYTVYQNFVIHYIQEGSGTFIVDGTVYNLSKNDGFILRDGQQVSYYGNKNNPWKYYWVGLGGIRFDQFIKSTSLDLKYNMQYKKNSHIVKLIKEICDYTLNTIENDINFFWYQSKIYDLIFSMTEEFPSNRITHLVEDGYEETAKEYINSNYQKPITVHEIASYIGISRSYLYKLFKKEYDLSPQEYLIEKRLNKAVNLLVHTTKPIKIIAKETGYDDQLHFSKSFRQRFGVSPTKFKEINNVEKII